MTLQNSLVIVGEDAVCRRAGAENQTANKNSCIRAERSDDLFGRVCRKIIQESHGDNPDHAAQEHFRCASNQFDRVCNPGLVA